MIRKDTILFEIEKLGLVLARILGLKQEGKTGESQQLAEATFLDELQIEESALDSQTTEELRAMLLEKSIPAGKLDMLAKVLFESVHPFEDTEQVKNRLHTVLLIFSMLENDHHIQSLDNLARREMIDNFLNNQQYE